MPASTAIKGLIETLIARHQQIDISENSLSHRILPRRISSRPLAFFDTVNLFHAGFLVAEQFAFHFMLDSHEPRLVFENKEGINDSCQSDKQR